MQSTYELIEEHGGVLQNVRIAHLTDLPEHGGTEDLAVVTFFVGRDLHAPVVVIEDSEQNATLKSDLKAVNGGNVPPEVDLHLMTDNSNDKKAIILRRSE